MSAIGNKVAFSLYTAGGMTGLTTAIYSMVAHEPDETVQSAGVSATFLLSILGGAVRTWTNPKSTRFDRMCSLAAVTLFSVDFVCAASGEKNLSMLAALGGGACLGLWNIARLPQTPPPLASAVAVTIVEPYGQFGPVQV